MNSTLSLLILRINLTELIESRKCTLTPIFFKACFFPAFGVSKLEALRQGLNWRGFYFDFWDLGRKI